MDSCLPDSNQRPLDDFRFWLLQSNALPTELRQVSGPKTFHLLDQEKLMHEAWFLSYIKVKVFYYFFMAKADPAAHLVFFSRHPILATFSRAHTSVFPHYSCALSSLLFPAPALVGLQWFPKPHSPIPVSVPSLHRVSELISLSYWEWWSLARSPRRRAMIVTPWTRCPPWNVWIMHLFNFVWYSRFYQRMCCCCNANADKFQPLVLKIHVEKAHSVSSGEIVHRFHFSQVVHKIFFVLWVGASGWHPVQWPLLRCFRWIQACREDSSPELDCESYMEPALYCTSVTFETSGDLRNLGSWFSWCRWYSGQSYIESEWSASKHQSGEENEFGES